VDRKRRGQPCHDIPKMAASVRKGRSRTGWAGGAGRSLSPRQSRPKARYGDGDVFIPGCRSVEFFWIPGQSTSPAGRRWAVESRSRLSHGLDADHAWREVALNRVLTGAWGRLTPDRLMSLS